MSQHSRGPRYIQHTDEQALNPPFCLEDTKCFFFALESSVSCQQRVLDRFLNSPAGGSLCYRAFFPQVFLYFGRIGSLHSSKPPDSQRGFVSYLEAGLWIPAVSIHQAGPFQVASKFFVFPLYTFVDSSIALVSGREVYGFPKELARIELPLMGEASEFRLWTDVFERFSPDEHGREKQLLHLERTGGAPCGELAQIITEAGAAVEAVARLVLGGPQLTIPGLTLPFSVVDALLNGVTFTFLKQLRSASEPFRASYQAIIEARTRASFQRLGLLGGEYTLHILPCASHPLVRQLGLNPHTFASIRGFYMEMDFALEAGIEAWTAP